MHVENSKHIYGDRRVKVDRVKVKCQTLHSEESVATL